MLIFVFFFKLYSSTFTVVSKYLSLRLIVVHYAQFVSFQCLYLVNIIIVHAERNQDKHDWAVVFVHGRVDARGTTILRISGELRLAGDRKLFGNQQDKYQHEETGIHTIAFSCTEPM